MTEKRRHPISDKELRQIALRLKDREWKLNKFLVTLSLTWSLNFDLRRDKLIITSTLITRDSAVIDIGRQLFAETIKIKTFSKLEFLIFLRRSGIAVSIVNHGRSDEEIDAFMEHINGIAHIGLL